MNTKLALILTITLALTVGCTETTDSSDDTKYDPVVNNYLLVATGQTTTYNDDGDAVAGKSGSA